MNLIKKIALLCVLFLTSLPLFSQTKPGITYLELNLNDSISSNPFARASSPLDVFRVIQRAAVDDNIQGILLNIGSINRGRDYLWELRRALEKFKLSGKKICAYISNADMDVYLLASVADKIGMDELGLLTMLGYSAGRGYVSQTLDKLGIGVMELRYFEYKSAAESFIRTSMSDADRRQYNDYLDDIFNHSRETLTNARGWTADEFDSIIDLNFMLSAKNAVAYNLVDYTGGINAVKNAIADIEETEALNFYLYGDNSTSLTGSELKYNIPRARGSLFSRTPIIAVVYAEGQTDLNFGMGIAKLSKTIIDLANNNRVKAIVVKIDSPGGSAAAADLLAEAIRYAQEKKPVVVSMGSMAASGGYWASMYAGHIMATPYTVTGSIGVIGTWFYDNGFYNRFGITTDVLKRGSHSDLMTGFLFPYRSLTILEEEQYKRYIVYLYDVFVGKVAAGRSMEKDDVEAAAQGRIFSGARALEAGLIDSIGNLSDALEIARNLAGISDKTAVIYKEYPEPTLMDNLLGRFPVAAKLFNSNARSIPTLTDILLPDADIRYRIEHNGQVLPILPMEFSIN